MIRRLFTLASALSLLLCFATVVLWVRSYRTTDCWRVQRYRVYECCSSGGVLRLEVATLFSRTTDWLALTGPQINQTNVPATDTWQVEHERGTKVFVLDTRNFALVRDQASVSAETGDLFMSWTRGATVSYVRLPHWCVAALFLILPIARLAAMRQRGSRIAEGRGASCGYDLRASADRCPECGTRVNSRTPAIK